MNYLFIIQVFLSIFLVPQIGYSQSIHDIARTGSVTSMEQHLKKTPSDLNTLSEQGITPFILACYRGNNAVAKLLMEKGADVGYCTSEGTAIFGLIFKDNLEILSDYKGLIIGSFPVFSITNSLDQNLGFQIKILF